jgi:hypothetical protein
MLSDDPVGSKQAGDEEKRENYHKKNQEHKGSAMRWIGFVIQI